MSRPDAQKILAVDEEQEIMEANLFMVHLLGKVFSGENITDWLIFGRLLHKRQGR